METITINLQVTPNTLIMLQIAIRHYVKKAIYEGANNDINRPYTVQFGKNIEMYLLNQSAISKDQPLPFPDITINELL